MKQIDEKTWLVHTQGSTGELTVYVDSFYCGDIHNGISFYLEDYGFFVVDREDIKHLAELLGFLTTGEEK